MLMRMAVTIYESEWLVTMTEGLCVTRMPFLYTGIGHIAIISWLLIAVYRNWSHLNLH